MSAAVVRLAPGEETAAIEAAARVVLEGGVLLYPTETIYGLGCDALREEAVRRVHQVKRRPDDKPMLVLVPSLSEAERLGEWHPRARALAEAFWPGPLTILVRSDAARFPWLAGPAGKVGVRVPGHPFCRALAAVSGRAILSTSANRSGEPYDGRPEHLRALFTGEVDLFVDAGELPPSPPSTVVDASGEIPVLVREGALPRAALAGHFA